ncbi:MAG: 50S ribosomal protein L6 [Luteibaculaceae bacterium]
MSRIGKLPVSLHKDAKVSFENNVITVKGPKGTLSQDIDPSIKVEITDAEIIFSRESDHKDIRSKHGLYRSLVSNMIKGVTEGYKTEQELVGVGYRATVNGQRLELSLGFSHNVIFEIPQGVSVAAETLKGKPPKVTFESHDKQLIGEVAAKLRSLRKPEPYKGKGIKFVGEIIRRKAGKSAGK